VYENIDMFMEGERERERIMVRNFLIRSWDLGVWIGKSLVCKVKQQAGNP
jgi:hypothetical protein